MPQELRFTEADIGTTGGAEISWANRHSKAFVRGTLAFLAIGTFGGGYLGYKTGEKGARSEARMHARSAVALRSCITSLESYTENGTARVRLSSLSEEAQSDCGVIGLSGVADSGLETFSAPHIEVSQPKIDLSITADVEGMQYSAIVEDKKAQEGDGLEKMGGAALGGLLGLVTVATIANSRAVIRTFKNSVDALTGNMVGEEERE